MRTQRLTEAAEWLLRMNDEARTEHDIAQWVEWCGAHPDNVAAFESLQQDWRDLDILKSAAGAGAVRRASSYNWRMAAGVVIVLIAGAGLYRQTQVPSAKKVTAAAENKTATLPDGSSIVLGARTAINIEFDATRRRLALSEGEAYFKVAQDKQRPFVVHAGQLDVTAIGTAFNVRHEKERIVVTVEEGTVRIASATASWRAQAGYQLQYSPRSATATLANVDPQAALKWRTGELAYVWEPLPAVLEDINRYSAHRITLADPRLAALRFTGTVFTNSIDDWLKAIQDAYSLRVERRDNGDIALQAADGVQN